MFPPVRCVVIATTGLDLLHQLRIKVACSLLMAERIDATLQAWDGQPADLLVVGASGAHAGMAMATARRAGVPVAVVSRKAASRETTSPNAIAYGLGVRDLADAMRRILEQSQRKSPEEYLPPLLQAMRLDRPSEGPVMMELGLFRLIVDAEHQIFHMLRRMPVSELLKLAHSRRWSATPLSRESFLAEYAPDVTSILPIESFLWSAVVDAMPDFRLPRIDERSRMRLRGWPDIDAWNFRKELLLPLGLMMNANCSAGELVESGGISMEMALSLFSLVSISGLASAKVLEMRAHRKQQVSPSRFLDRIARRFGLSGAGNG